MIQLNPVRKPYINEQLIRQGWAGRVGACVSYQARRLEYKISPGGLLRNWIRNLMLLALLLLVPAVVLLPVVGTIGWQLADITEAFMLGCQQFFCGVVFIVKTMVLMALVAAAVSVFALLR